MPSISFPWIFGLSETYGIKIGFFAITDDFSDAGYETAKDAYDAGKIWIDQYSMSPEIQQKIVNHETITEEEFVSAYHGTLLPAFITAVGKKPIALSYAYGNESFRDYVCPLYLAARNSGGAASNGGTDYGLGFGNPSNNPYSFANFKSRSSTIRWYDRVVGSQSFADGISEVSALIDATKINGGWLNNFTHFHSVYWNGDQSVYEQYFQMLASKNENGDIYFAGYGEAVAYLVYRQMITKAVMYSPNEHRATQLRIRLEAQNTLGIDTDLLQVPISVKFSTVGTPLAGKTITSDCNLVPLGGGEYVVEIPYTGRFPYAIINGS